MQSTDFNIQFIYLETIWISRDDEKIKQKDRSKKILDTWQMARPSSAVQYKVKAARIPFYS